MSVVTTWLVNSLIMAAVLTAGAVALELAARSAGRAARWGWIAALAGSVVLPWVLRWAPGRMLAEAVPVGVPMFSLDPLLAAGAASSQSAAGWSAPELALVLWAAASLAMVAYIARVVVQLGRARRSWREADVEGGRVYVTRNTGPAALGVRRGMIVVPSWALDLDAELRSLLLAHEREHIRAGDPRLLLTGLALVAAMPWNPLLWFQLLRLRHAIELDCDARVLAGGVDPERYGSLLLEVGRRRGSSTLVMATFAEPRMFLHERIARIARWPAERRPARAAAFSVLALLLFATALNARDPLRSAQPAAAADGVPARDLPVMVSDTPPPTPVYMPRTVEPEFKNRLEIQRALVSHYPAMLRDAGIGGVAYVWLYIDEEGTVQQRLLSKSSGYEQLDAAAMAVAEVMRFSPAMNRTQPVPVWVELPIRFHALSQNREVAVEAMRRTAIEAERAAAERAQAERRAAAERAPTRVVQEVRAPTSELRETDLTTQPEILNRAEVQRMLVRSYPAMLRDAGIGGTAQVWIHIDADGMVTQTRVADTSGYEALDAAAVQVAGMMRFTPPENDGQPVAAWIRIPIRFSAR